MESVAKRVWGYKFWVHNEQLGWFKDDFKMVKFKILKDFKVKEVWESGWSQICKQKI